MMKPVLCSNEAGLMKAVWCLIRSWTRDLISFSLRGKCNPHLSIRGILLTCGRWWSVAICLVVRKQGLTFIWFWD